jgi:hypothetical protein
MTGVAFLKIPKWGHEKLQKGESDEETCFRAPVRRYRVYFHRVPCRKYTSGKGQVPQAAMVSIAADGSCVGAYVYGSSGSYAGATSISLWSASAGDKYDLSSYSLPVSVTDSSPMTSVGSLSADHNTLTINNSGTITVFLRQ